MGNWKEAPESFYRIIMERGPLDNKLGMPTQFVEKYGHQLSNFISIYVPVSGIWSVRLERAGKMLWLQDGWQKFMEHHSIRPGHFLLFKYRGNSRFDVHIFDMTATEIDYSPMTSPEPPNYLHQIPVYGKEKSGLASGVSTEILDSLVTGTSKHNALNDCPKQKARGGIARVSPTNRHVDFQLNESEHAQDVVGLKQSPSNNFDQKTNSSRKNLFPENKEKARSSSCRSSKCLKRRWTTTRKKQRAYHAAGKFEPDNPSFAVTLKDYNLRKHVILNVPPQFAKEHCSGVGEAIELQDSAGRKWPVRFIQGGTCSCLSKGWAAFSKANNLKRGDVCVFELIQSDEAILRVSVSRAKRR